MSMWWLVCGISGCAAGAEAKGDGMVIAQLSLSQRQPAASSFGTGRFLVASYVCFFGGAESCKPAIALGFDGLAEMGGAFEGTSWKSL